MKTRRSLATTVGRVLALIARSMEWVPLSLAPPPTSELRFSVVSGPRDWLYDHDPETCPFCKYMRGDFVLIEAPDEKQAVPGQDARGQSH